jgi:hypothetical protein
MSLNASAKSFYPKGIKDEEGRPLYNRKAGQPRVKPSMTTEEWIALYAFRPDWSYTDNDTLEDVLATYWADVSKK